MKPGQKNSYQSLKSINIEGKNYKYFTLLESGGSQKYNQLLNVIN